MRIPYAILFFVDSCGILICEIIVKLLSAHHQKTDSLTIEVDRH
jgi:hypothetical protein